MVERPAERPLAGSLIEVKEEGRALVSSNLFGQGLPRCTLVTAPESISWSPRTFAGDEQAADRTTIWYPTASRNSRQHVMWKLILAAIGILLIVSSPTKAAFRVILCDTPEQIERVFTLHAGGTTFEEAIESTNLQAEKPNACSKATVEASFLGVVRDITLRGNAHVIVKVVVTAVSDGERMLPVPLLKQFGVMPGGRDNVLDDKGGI